MKSLQEMTYYKRVESKQDAGSFQEQEEKQQNDKRQSYQNMQAMKKMQLYNASRKVVDVSAQINGTGNYVNVISVAI